MEDFERPKKFSTILQSQFNHNTLPVTPFKEKSWKEKSRSFDPNQKSFYYSKKNDTSTNNILMY